MATNDRMRRLCTQRRLDEASFDKSKLNAVGKFRVANPESYKVFAKLDKAYQDYMKWMRGTFNPNGNHDKAARSFYLAYRDAWETVKKGGGDFQKLFPGIVDLERDVREVNSVLGKLERQTGYHQAMETAKWPVPSEWQESAPINEAARPDAKILMKMNDFINDMNQAYHEATMAIMRIENPDVKRATQKLMLEMLEQKMLDIKSWIHQTKRGMK